jgi:beta-lactam-binding protein with PASTA domain
VVSMRASYGAGARTLPSYCDIRAMATVLRRRSPVQRFLLSATLVVAGLLSVGIIVDQAILPAISRASPEVRLPMLVGLPLAAATSKLDSLGLVVKSVKEQYSATIAEGSVMSQLPFAGSTVKRGRHVYLTISSGEETVTMPSIEGMTLRDARMAVMRVGLRLDDVTYQPHDSVPNGSVIHQSVAARSLVSYGTLIQATVSSGPRGMYVPDVQGQPLDVATEVLLAAGFTLGRVSYVHSGLFEANTVVRQSPRDSLIPKGSPVNVEVAR